MLEHLLGLKFDIFYNLILFKCRNVSRNIYMKMARKIGFGKAKKGHTHYIPLVTNYQINWIRKQAYKREGKEGF
jgi:hypothetical protein